jgi:hypothetical protein
VSRRTIATVAAGVVGATVAAAALYPRYFRDPCLSWGATVDEAARTLPGDDLLPVADIVSTRAVSIDAPPSAIWPWLAQMGPGRGGAYTYDWVENLMGLDMHSADRVLPEHQDIAVGDVHALGSSGPRMRVAVVEPEHALVFASEDGHWVWSFTIRAEPGGTRLISRNRIRTPEASVAGRLMNTVVMEPGSLVMERKMLLGIKERAERLAAG